MNLTTEQQALVKRLEQSRNNGTGLMLQDPASVGILHQLIVDLMNPKTEIPKGATHYSETIMERIYLKESYKYGWKCYVFGDWMPYEAEDNEEIKPL